MGPRSRSIRKNTGKHKTRPRKRSPLTPSTSDSGISRPRLRPRQPRPRSSAAPSVLFFSSVSGLRTRDSMEKEQEPARDVTRRRRRSPIRIPRNSCVRLPVCHRRVARPTCARVSKLRPLPAVPPCRLTGGRRRAKDAVLSMGAPRPDPREVKRGYALPDPFAQNSASDTRR